MGEAYIVDAVRTPVGRRGGGLSEEHPADLGAHVIKGLVERTGINPSARSEERRVGKECRSRWSPYH